MSDIASSPEPDAGNQWADAGSWEIGWIEPDVPAHVYSDEVCVAALRGESVPLDMTKVHHVTRLCVLRGIRHHPGFATELRNLPRYPEFTRALNARDIMINVIPDMSNPEEYPYCIWYPDTASEDTYRSLVARYPQMRYNVGRACAVAGYAELYHELGLLPDISIAEEARDKSQCPAILEHIQKQPVRWLVMDDYTRSVNLDQPVPARYGLNGDTAVKSSLDYKRRFKKPSVGNNFVPWTKTFDSSEGTCESASDYFNITEDCGIDEYEGYSENRVTASDGPWPRNIPRKTTFEMTELLWNPLPFDLPQGNKDILILMAAFYGDLDRYERLRRPTLLLREKQCVIRGIYHNTMFAKWWSKQPADNLPGGCERAITARFLINNDLSRVTPETPQSAIPYWFWYPNIASPETYLEFARRQPHRKPQVALALMAGNYQSAWDMLDIEPTKDLFLEAIVHHNPHFLKDLRKRCANRGLSDLEESARSGWLIAEQRTRQAYKPQYSGVVANEVFPDDVELADTDTDHVYDIFGVNVDAVELFASLSGTELMPKGSDQVRDLKKLYYEMRGQPPDAPIPVSELQKKSSWLYDSTKFGRGWAGDHYSM
ncbi:hypothetical protein C2857_004976 [Epichloe festucae Fl1]|uniref:Uncharacterized protein n=1 Tax=Epichloe festucae (strain Fl1) TaxID=877507 RepID=A0A7S9PX11_EPIFF|nr:hypothetical protein C2857_004976 [Epichloe festucae Fl1]